MTAPAGHPGQHDGGRTNEMTEQAMETETKEQELLSWAWAIIANAGGGDWNQEAPEWRAAAARWRDEYHKTLPSAAIKAPHAR